MGSLLPRRRRGSARELRAAPRRGLREVGVSSRQAGRGGLRWRAPRGGWQEPGAGSRGGRSAQQDADGRGGGSARGREGGGALEVRGGRRGAPAETPRTKAGVRWGSRAELGRRRRAATAYRYGPVPARRPGRQGERARAGARSSRQWGRRRRGAATVSARPAPRGRGPPGRARTRLEARTARARSPQRRAEAGRTARSGSGLSRSTSSKRDTPRVAAGAEEIVRFREHRAGGAELGSGRPGAARRGTGAGVARERSRAAAQDRRGAAAEDAAAAQRPQGRRPQARAWARAGRRERCRISPGSKRRSSGSGSGATITSSAVLQNWRPLRRRSQGAGPT